MPQTPAQQRANKAYYQRHKERLKATMYAKRKKRSEMTPEELAEIREYQRVHSKKYRDKNPGYAKRYRKENPKKAKQSVKNWSEKNKDKVLGYGRAYRSRNIEKLRARDREKIKKNRPKRYAAHAKYRAKKRGQTPENANNKTINTMYELADRIGKCLGIPHAIDHWNPLDNGGLHHQANLVALPARVNLIKNALEFVNLNELYNRIYPGTNLWRTSPQAVPVW